MEQRLVQSVVSRPHSQDSGEFGRQNHVKCSLCRPPSWGTDGGSIAGYLELFTFESPSTLPSGSLNNFSDLWMCEGLLDDSPLSTYVSTSHNGGVPAPSTDMPTNLTVDPSVVHHGQASLSSAFFVDQPENRRKRNHSDVLAWVLRQLSSTSYSYPTYHETFLPTTQDCILQLGSSNCISSHEHISYATGMGELSPSQPYSTINTDVIEKDSGSEFDSCGSNISSTSNGSQECINQQREGKPAAVYLNKLGLITHPFHKAIKPRHYECPLMDMKMPQNLCARRFQRRGHLRRHIVTVHGNGSFHLCKVCAKAFSRHDNLREHYWTHLRRGGKTGKNIKMSLLELSAILGSEERQLVKRLQMRLNDAQAKKTKAKSLCNAIKLLQHQFSDCANH
ncbi:hypothetical protein ACJQWK_09925 [Exserohilum turcicum]